jgi:hypothetical protein
MLGGVAGNLTSHFQGKQHLHIKGCWAKQLPTLKKKAQNT